MRHNPNPGAILELGRHCPLVRSALDAWAAGNCDWETCLKLTCDEMYRVINILANEYKVDVPDMRGYLKREFSGPPLKKQRELIEAIILGHELMKRLQKYAIEVEMTKAPTLIIHRELNLNREEDG